MDIEKLCLNKNLTELERQVLIYIVENISTCISEGVRGVARNTYTSSSTVIRVAKKLGYNGFIEMVYKLKQNLKTVESNQFTLNDIDIANVFQIEDDALNELTDILINNSSKIFIYAAGFSEIVGQYIYKKLMTLGIDCIGSYGSDCASIYDTCLNTISTLIVISKSGETDFVLYRVNRAKERGIKIICITGNKNSTLAKVSDILILINDTNPMDDSNYYPNTFFGFTLLAFEYVISTYFKSIE